MHTLRMFGDERQIIQMVRELMAENRYISISPNKAFVCVKSRRMKDLVRLSHIAKGFGLTIHIK